MSTPFRSIAFLVAALVTAACNDTSPVSTEAADAAPEQSAVSGLAAAGAPLYRSRTNGDYASYYGASWEAGGSTWVSLHVSRNFRDAWLYFSVERCTHGEDWWDYQCEYSYGSGSIPARDLSGSARQGLVLDTDTRTNPDFHLWNTDGGRISVRWQPNGWYETRNSGSSEYRWMNTISRTSGTSSSASASATGSIVGIMLPAYGSGYMGSANNVSMTFERRTQ